MSGGLEGSPERLESWSEVLEGSVGRLEGRRVPRKALRVSPEDLRLPGGLEGSPGGLEP